MIEIKNLIKKYNGNTVLSIDELNIDKGKMYAIIGPNGSGKSTLFKSISNKIIPDRGSIILDNKNIKEYIKSNIVDNNDLNVYFYVVRLLKND